MSSSVMAEAVAQFHADCANAELRAVDNLLRRVLSEGHLQPQLAGLIVRVLDRHETDAMTSSDDRELCRQVNTVALGRYRRAGLGDDGRRSPPRG